MRLFFLSLLIGTLGFSSCNSNNTNSNTANANRPNANGNSNSPFIEPHAPIKPVDNPDPNFKPCNPYYPLKPGSATEYTLQYSSPVVADVRVVVDQAEENGRKVFVERTQIIDKSGGLNKDELTERKYICDNGRVQIISEKVDNRTEKGSSKVDTNFRDVAIYLADPASLMRKGYTWSYNFQQQFQTGTEAPATAEPLTISFESQGEEEVKVPAGTFKAIRVTRKIKNTTVNDFFVPGLGMVKRANNEGTTWELKSYSGLQPLTK